MKEQIFNIFAFVDADDIIRQFGIVCHEIDGSDGVKTAYLQARVNDDYKAARMFLTPAHCVAVGDGKQEKGAISWGSFHELLKVGHGLRVIEPIFVELKAPMLKPLMVITPIVNGKPKIDAVMDLPE